MTTWKAVSMRREHGEHGRGSQHKHSRVPSLRIMFHYPFEPPWTFSALPLLIHTWDRCLSHACLAFSRENSLVSGSKARTTLHLCGLLPAYPQALHHLDSPGFPDYALNAPRDICCEPEYGPPTHTWAPLSGRQGERDPAAIDTFFPSYPLRKLSSGQEHTRLAKGRSRSFAFVDANYVPSFLGILSCSHRHVCYGKFQHAMQLSTKPTRL
jgi:hypothetical protein